jgi:Helicase conserved C-terminal domain
MNTGKKKANDVLSKIAAIKNLVTKPKKVTDKKKAPPKKRTKKAASPIREPSLSLIPEVPIEESPKSTISEVPLKDSPIKESPVEFIKESADKSPEESSDKSKEESPVEFIKESSDKSPEESPVEFIKESPEDKSQEESSDKSQEEKIELMPLKTNAEKYNQFILNRERKEHESYAIFKDNLLYPTLDDPDFSYKISRRAEFADTKYDGEIMDISAQANLLCSVPFEIAPHQLFVKNFLSAETPYNSLLLYHGLGSGKTCSAIGIAEEMRAYMKQLELTKKIIIVASPNVQDNFKLQLFDERRLELLENGQWNLNTCVGPSLLKEINPNNLRGLTRERIISQIKTIIQSYYVFMGDKGKFANYIQKIIHIPEDSGYSEEEKRKIVIKRIKHYFNNRLVIIDEVHNMRIADSNKQKLTTTLLNKIARISDNMRLLLLSATPLYNSYDEIIWLANLMNTNDKRGLIKTSDVFAADGSFINEVKDKKGHVIKESGRSLLIRKITGYISYVRGENPYIFPYRVYPATFDPDRAIQSIPYPKRQMNQQAIDEPLRHIPVYINSVGEYQGRAYKFIMETLGLKSFSTTNKMGKKRVMPTFENMEGFGYNLLLDPLEALIMVYPNPDLDELLLEKSANPEFNQEKNTEIIKSMIGKAGLKQIMKSKSTYEPIPIRNGFEYLPKVLTTYGEIFSPGEIHKYSSKIANICEIIRKSKGIIMIYSQYIDGGIIPMALALESMGFSRYSSTPAHAKPLLKKPKEPIDSLTMKTRSEKTEDFKPARYAIISGDKFFSHDNAEDIKFVTNKENANGEFCKVLLISKAASEGLDFKCIRQIHILEPWYNMNRIEQIIGRGVRNLSHCSLPFRERNVEIYLHGTILDSESGEEAADLYVYRSAEKKAIQIGQVTRVLKENAVDCLLNISQTNFTVDRLHKVVENQGIELELSSGKTVPFEIGDKPFTEVCDYMDNCAFQCAIREEAKKSIAKGLPLNRTTYGIEFLKSNSNLIMKKIRDLYKEQTAYERKHLISAVNRVKTYPIEHILYALTRFVSSKNEEIIDKYGRSGYLINRGQIYAFQPNEISDEGASIYERKRPIDYKRVSLKMELAKRRMQPTEIEEQHNDSSGQTKETSYETLLRQLKEQIDILHKKDMKITASDKNWYKYANIVSSVLRSIHDIPIEMIKKYAVYHFLDLLSMFDKLVFIRHLFKKEGHIGLTDLEVICKLYFEENLMFLEGTRAILLFDGEKNQLWIQSKENVELWSAAEYTDEELFKGEIESRFVIPKEKINRKEVGFVYSFKGNQTVIKIKDMSQKRSVGAKLDDAGKPIVLKYLAGILPNQDVYKEKKGEKKVFMNLSLCIILEILMRWLTENRRLTGEPLLFFNAETAYASNIIGLQL